MTHKDQRKQQALFLVLVLGVLIAAVGAGVHFRSIDMAGFDRGSGTGSHARYTNMADAQVLCQGQVKEIFGKRVSSLMVDNHSSRLDQKAGLFKVFMEAEIFDNDRRQGVSARHYFNCYVHTNKLSIASFQFAKGSAPVN